MKDQDKTTLHYNKPKTINMDKAEKIAPAKESIMAAVHLEYKRKPQNSYLEALIESRLDLLYEEGKTAGIMVMLGKKDLNEANH